MLLEKVLGYVPPLAGTPATFKPKQAMGAGTVDLAIGSFPPAATPAILAPFELKGAKTKDLDAPMPGRKISPVQQAWQYANAVPGVKWVLVSNYREIRLYAFGEGNQDFERFDLSKIDDPEEYARLALLLSAENFLGTRTSELLRQSKDADRVISSRLYADYKQLREDLIAGVNAETGNADPVAAVGTAQKILDRVLFVAFAEDRGLLPAKSLEKAFEMRNPYHPQPVWENFKGLFRGIDEGSATLGISKYNGGLFQFDKAVDGLKLSDAICEKFKVIGGYHFDTEVSVTVLGHIFDQSVADVERLLAAARGEGEDEPQAASGVKGRRKRDGIVYTPDHIARFIVEKTLGAHIDDLFNATMAKYAKGDPADYATLKFKKKADELQAWLDYRFALQLLRVVDPACGSGAFLVTAFDYLKPEYERANKKIAELRGHAAQIDLEDIDREILSQNLYGDDVNAESVEITRLSLWLKTARKGKELDSLDHNIRVGDSLIEDSNFAYLKHGFSWHAAFPEVFAAGGFDVVLGNPPYVRMELIKPMKPYLEKRFEVVSDRADLYCYFFERGLRLLKPGGRLGYISSSTFFKTGSGEPLRRYLLKEAAIDTVTDFGDLQVFEGVTTYPAILTMRRMKPDAAHTLRFWKLQALPAGNFAAEFSARAEPFPQAKLGGGSWELENPHLRKLREKITDGKKTLREVYGAPLYGIKTGLNQAFVVSENIRNHIVQLDPHSESLFKPFLEGKDIRRWHAEPRSLWIALIPKGWTNSKGNFPDEQNAWDWMVQHYPALTTWLSGHKAQAEHRTDKGDYWWELRACDYYGLYEKNKIIFAHFQSEPLYFLDSDRFYTNNRGYILDADHFALSLLNSRLVWFFLTGVTSILRGGFFEATTQNTTQIPIPDANADARNALKALSQAAQMRATEASQAEIAFRRRIPDLCPAGREAKLSNRLHDWWELADFAAFRAEVKKCFKADIPVAERNDWDDLFSKGKADIAKLSAEIRQAEDEINAIVYRLFDLTPDEIVLLETAIGVRGA